MKILAVFDYPIPPPDDQWAKHLSAEDWRPERNVIEALEKLGHQVHLLGLHSDIRPLVETVSSIQPDIVFNLTECFNGKRTHESNIAGLLELLGVPYTGSNPTALSLCHNKFFTKRILSPHKIKYPRSLVFPIGSRERSLKSLRFPVFIKPLGAEASEAIAQNSLCETPESCRERVRLLHEHYRRDALVEEYIEGRELYAGVIGTKRLRVLPLREMVFTRFPEDRPRFATFKAKWDDDFRKRWGIRNTYAAPVDQLIQRRINRISRAAFRALGLSGYGRLDLRVRDDGEVYLIEMNPNPSLAIDDELAMAARKAGIPYPSLVRRILHSGLEAAGRTIPSSRKAPPSPQEQP